MIEDGGGEPGRGFGFEPRFLIGPPPPLLHNINRAALFEGMTLAFPLRKARGHGSAEGGIGIAGGYASVVSQKGRGAVCTTASQESVRPSFRSRTTVSALDTIGYRRFSGALMSQGPGTDPRGPFRKP